MDKDDNFYEETPPQTIFDEIKAAAMGIWNKYDDTYKYATEKKDRIKDLENIGGNSMTMVGMFDTPNQARLLMEVSQEAVNFIVKRLS